MNPSQHIQGDYDDQFFHAFDQQTSESDSVSFALAKRIHAEYESLMLEPPISCISLHVRENNIRFWHAVLLGPAKSPYDGGKFQFEIKFPATYPISPPSIRCLTRIFHCNIDHTGTHTHVRTHAYTHSSSTLFMLMLPGRVCMDILNSIWIPDMNVANALEMLCLLLEEPNADNPLVADIAKQFKADRASHDKIAREWTRVYAGT
jgi:ubiquitin-protein ligase